MINKVLSVVGAIALLGVSCAGVCRCVDGMNRRENERNADWIRGCHVVGYDRQRYTTEYECPGGSHVHMSSYEAERAMRVIAEEQDR